MVYEPCMIQHRLYVHCKKGFDFHFIILKKKNATRRDKFSNLHGSIGDMEAMSGKTVNQLWKSSITHYRNRLKTEIS